MSTVVKRLRSARTSRGLSQRDVARRMHTSQPAIARLENAGADPRLHTVERYAEAVGVTIDVRPVDPVDIPGIAAATADALAEGDSDAALRHVIQLLDDLADTDPDTVRTGLRHEPDPIGDRRYDALLAAACERAARRAGVRTPGWTAAPSRFLDEWWFPLADILGRLPTGLACHALASSPPEFAVRGVFIDRDTLASV